MSPPHPDHSTAEQQADLADQNSRLGRLGLILRRHEQIALFGLLIVCSVILSSYFLHLHLMHNNIIDVDDMDYQAAAYSVDINQAAWPELANIPNIGEKLAKAIIEYRETHGDFSDLGQLNEVPGIGPAKLERLKEYVLPIAPKPDNTNSRDHHHSRNRV
jgi:competence protein ComEA